MNSFEWMELDTLSHEISSAEGRLEAAKWANDPGLIRSLEVNLAEMQERRGHLLTRVGSGVSYSGNSPPSAMAVSGSASEHSPDASLLRLGVDRGAEGDKAEPTGELEAADQTVVPIIPNDLGATEPPRPTSLDLGAGWEQPARVDIQRAKATVEHRRLEMLARHAEELRALDEEQAEIEGLDRAIIAFIGKYNRGLASRHEPLSAENEEAARTLLVAS